MKLHPVRLILACAALATAGVASAQAISPAADQERRTRNREEALAKFQAQQDRASGNAARTSTRGTAAGTSERGTSERGTTARASDRGTAAGGPTLGDRARGAAKSVRNFTHRQAEKARNFSDRQDRRWGNKGNSDRTATNRSKQRGTPD